MFKIYPSEVEGIIALLEAGYSTVGLCEKAPYIAQEEMSGDEYWEQIHGLNNSSLFLSSDKKEVREFFKKPFEAVNPHLTISQRGTHTGMLVFTFGWCHDVKVTRDQLKEAVMPQCK